MYQRPIQSVNSFKSYRANKLKSTDRQTDTFAKTIFSGSEGLKTWTFDKNRGGHILHKSNTFSDENVKIEISSHLLYFNIYLYVNHEFHALMLHNSDTNCLIILTLVSLYKSLYCKISLLRLMYNIRWTRCFRASAYKFLQLMHLFFNYYLKTCTITLVTRALFLRRHKLHIVYRLYNIYIFK